MNKTLPHCPPLLRVVFLSFCALGLLLPSMGWGQATLPYTFGGPWNFTSGGGTGNPITRGNSDTYSSNGEARMDATGHYVQVYFTGTAGSFTVKLIAKTGGGAWSGSVKIQSSTDATTWTDLQEVTTIGNNNASVSPSNAVPSGHQYVRVYFANKVSGSNVGVDDVSITAGASSNKYWDVTAGASNGVGGTGTWGTTFSTTATGDATLTTAGSGDNVFFQGTAGTVTLAASQTVNAMTFGVAGYTIATSGSGTRTLTGPITLNHSLTLSPISGSDLTLPSIISGTGGLTKTGAGTVILSSSGNTYTGKTTINSGFISTTGESRFGANPGSFTADQITLNGGGISTNGGDINFNSNRGITLGASGGTFQANGSNTITLTNVVTGSGGLTKTGTGTLIFAGAHTYTGTTTITAGTARLNAAERISNSSNMVLNGGTFSTGSSTGFSETVGTLNLSASSTIALGTGSHTLTFANSSAVSWTGTTLTITGWTGTCGNSGTAGKIFFGSDNSGLTQTQLDKITFSGFSGSKAVLLSTGELVPSCANSDIIRNTSFTEPSNIDYSLYQATDITTANSIEVASFTIQDGGISLNDADAFATTLSAITFSVSNHSNLRRIALYDGTTEIAEVAAAASVTFSSLSLAAPDNSSKNFSLRATFQSTVTDNAQFQFTVTSATAAGGGSGFATANAGGASSSTTGDRNRIEVTADRLVFTTQPSNTPISTNMTPAVVVAARDANGNTDSDYSTTVTLNFGTGCGTLSGNTATPSGGVATFSSLQGTSAQTGATLVASSGSLLTATSNPFNFTVGSPVIIAQQNFDGATTWNYATPVNSTTCSSGSGIATTSTTNTAGVSGSNAFTKAHSTDNANGELTSVSVLTFDNVTIPANYINIKVKFKIASLGSGTGAGVDGGGSDACNDLIKLETSTDGGSTYSVSFENRPNGGDQTWSYGANPVSYNHNANSTNNVNAGDYTINFPNGTTQVRIRFTFRSNRTNEIWALDDLVLQAEIPTQKHYRSVASGDFSSACTWEVADDEAFTSGVAVASLPPNAAAHTIKIRNGHTVTINSALTLDQLTVESGGTLELNNFAITWNNGPGVDFTVNGTYIDNASSAQNSSFSTGATWQLGANGTFIKTRNSSAAVFRDNYEGGMSTIPATANWIIRYTGASDVAFTTVDGTYYPNLTFENASTTNPHTLLQTFLGNSDYATVKGNLDIGGTTYSNGIQIRNINTNATPLTVLGNLIIRAGSKLENTNGSTNGTGFAVRGSITVDGELNVAGTGASGLLSLEGTSAQSISGSGTITLYDVTIDNSAGVNLSRNLSVGNNLVLTAGTLGIGTHTLTYSGSSITRTSGNLNASTGTLVFANGAALTLPANVFSGNVNNLTLNGAGGVTLGSNTTVVGNLTLTNGTLTVAGNTLTYSGSSITRTSGLLNASHSAATLAFANTSALTLPAGLFSGNINNLTISGSGGITLGDNTTVASTLTLSSGNILTGSHYLELGTSTSQKGTLSRTAGYVVGNMRRWFSGTNSGDASGLFPLGNPALFNRMIKVEFTAAPTTGGHLTASWQNAAMGGAGLPINGIPAVGSCPTFNVTSTATEYWKLDNQSGTLTDGSYTLSATAENLVGVTSLCELRLLKRVGLGNWTAPGTHIAPSGSVSSPTVSASGISGFSNFGFGGLSGVNPLPLTLLSFTGEPTERGAVLRWRVTDVRDFSHYEIEKMIQGKFVAIAQVPHTDTPKMEFAYLDEDFATDSYYRLKMVNTDGSQSYSKVVFVGYNPNNLTRQLSLYPNPSSGSITLKTNLNGIFSVQIFDALGNYLGQKEGSATQIEKYLEEHIKIPGLYLLQFRAANQQFFIKLVRE